MSEASAGTSKRPRIFLTRLRIQNFKSIGKCDVRLEPVTVVVGRNGAGKSNFLDALRFVSEGLQTSLDHALKSRGGIDAVRRRSTGHPRNFALELELQLPTWDVARYAFEIAARPRGGFVVRQESLRLETGAGKAVAHFHIKEGLVQSSSPEAIPAPSSDRLFLVAASSLREFRPVYDALTSMGFYNLNPEVIKELQAPDAGELLHRDGRNLASVIGRLATDKPKVKDRITRYLRTIVPGISDVARVSLGPRETLEFRQVVAGSTHPWRFYASSISDGTLRALAALVAVTQLADRKVPVPLVGIEEPETALHPAAASALMEALREAASRTQVVITSHSPDLLDQLRESEQLLVMAWDHGDSRVATVDKASRSAIEKHLYSLGEMLRMDQLEPDREDLARQEQSQLFGKS